jgi:hypothetical protein
MTMRSQQLFSPMVLFALLCGALIFVGMNADLGRFITPETGMGYTLGIVGGSMMILLLIYPARKRIQALAPIGSIKAWFQIHMVLGLLGPLLVLFHSNFRTGATNSNVALYCMLLVSGSGLIGRYFYSRIHTQMAGSQESLAELRGQISRLQLVSSRLAFVPDFAERVSTLEAVMTARLDAVPGLLRPAVVLVRSWQARLRMYSHLRHSAQAHALLHGFPVSRWPADTLMRCAGSPNSRLTKDCSRCGTYCTCHCSSCCWWRAPSTSWRFTCTDAN